VKGFGLSRAPVVGPTALRPSRSPFLFLTFLARRRLTPAAENTVAEFRGRGLDHRVFPYPLLRCLFSTKERLNKIRTHSGKSRQEPIAVLLQFLLS
jgi:hypothetical protein